MQNTKFVTTSQGEDILEILFFFTWRIAQFAIQVLNICIIMSKIWLQKYLLLHVQ